MSIKTTRLKTVQLPKTLTIDLTSQMNGKTQTFHVGRQVYKQDVHHLIWNSTIYRNTDTRIWYIISEDGTLRTLFDKAPVGGPDRNLIFVLSEHPLGEAPTVTKEEMRDAIAAEAALRKEGDDNEIAAREELDRQVNKSISEETKARIAGDDNLQTQIDAMSAASDVVDVVDTKADLDKYDTSKLGDNDVIKVLNDETQDGAITYYRFSKTSGGFKLIGSTGPYYTKGEVDAIVANTDTDIQEKLDNKQDKLVDGVTIKTLNGETLLGAGNYEIVGGSIFDEDNVAHVKNLPDSVVEDLETKQTSSAINIDYTKRSLVDGSTSTGSVALNVANETDAGLMSPEDKQKLDSMASNITEMTPERFEELWAAQGE